MSEVGLSPGCCLAITITTRFLGGLFSLAAGSSGSSSSPSGSVIVTMSTLRPCCNMIRFMAIKALLM